MSNIKISQLNSSLSLTGDEILPLVQSGSTVKTSINDIIQFSKPYKSFVSSIYRYDREEIYSYSSQYGNSGMLLKDRFYYVSYYEPGDDFSNIISIVNDKPFDVGCIFIVTGDSRFSSISFEHLTVNVWNGTIVNVLDNINNNVIYNDFGYDLEWNYNYETYNGYWGMSLSFPENIDQSKLTFFFSQNEPNNFIYGQPFVDYYRTVNDDYSNNITYFYNIDYNWTTSKGFDGLSNWVHDMDVQVDGKIIVGGEFDSRYDYYGTSYYVNGLLRFNPDCTIDETFMQNFTGGTIGFRDEFDNPAIIKSVKIQSNGKILIGGNFSIISDGMDEYYTKGIVRLHSDGTVDSTFLSPNPNEGFTNYNEVKSIDVTSNNKIIVIGQNLSEYTYSGVSYSINDFIVLNEDGSPNETFLNNVVGFEYSPYSNSDLYKVIVLNNDKILIGGIFNSYEDINGLYNVSGVIRLNSDYTLDNTYYTSGFTYNINGDVYDIAVQDDGKIIVGGGFFGFEDSGSTYSDASYLIRLNPNGTFDNTFYYNTGNNEGLNSSVYSIDIGDSGEIIVGGDFNDFTIYLDNYGANSYNYGYYVVLNDRGLPIIDPNNGVNSSVYKVKYIGNNKILIGGDFYTDYAYNYNIYNNGGYILRMNMKNDISSIIDWSGVGGNSAGMYKIYTEVRLYN